MPRIDSGRLYTMCSIVTADQNTPNEIHLLPPGTVPPAVLNTAPDSPERRLEREAVRAWRRHANGFANLLTRSFAWNVVADPDRYVRVSMGRKRLNDMQTAVLLSACTRVTSELISYLNERGSVPSPEVWARECAATVAADFNHETRNSYNIEALFSTAATAMYRELSCRTPQVILTSEAGANRQRWRRYEITADGTLMLRWIDRPSKFPPAMDPSQPQPKRKRQWRIDLPYRTRSIRSIQRSQQRGNRQLDARYPLNPGTSIE